jgi:hypothetical protein
MATGVRNSMARRISGPILRSWIISTLGHCIIFLLMTLTWYAAQSPGEIFVLSAGHYEPSVDQPLVVLAELAESDLEVNPEIDAFAFASGGSQSSADAARGDTEGGIFAEGGGELGRGTGRGVSLGFGTDLDGGSRAGARFYGVKAEGRSFVFVVDSSGSMEGDRFRCAIEELKRSILALRRAQSFFVYFYSDDAYPMPADSLLKAEAQHRRSMFRWINKAKVGGGTYPLRALQGALELNPDAIFFLTDGEFDESVVEAVSQADRSPKTPIHSICIQSKTGAKLLEKIAANSGGSFREVD